MHQCQSSLKRNIDSPNYTLDEFRDWIYAQDTFEELYKEWVDSGFKRKTRPSADRKIDSIGYRISNLQLMTAEQNLAKGHKDVLEGRNTKPTVQVIVECNEIGISFEAHSISEAARILGVTASYAHIAATKLTKKGKKRTCKNHTITIKEK